MAGFVKGRELCRGFFHQWGQPILERHFPGLAYSAGLIGYGSDVLGYDDPVSTDHMWGPRFYLFLREEDMGKKGDILRVLGEELPPVYRGYSVHFSPPDPSDHGVRHPEPAPPGRVSPLVWVSTFPGYLEEQLGTRDLEHLRPLEWLALSEHRLLSLVSGEFYRDDLGCQKALEPIRYYPPLVRLYLVASNWAVIASEQAFVKRTGMVGDDMGSRLICARIVERLMRLCFLYRGVYAPYSKWFGTAFARLEGDSAIRQALEDALGAGILSRREERLAQAQSLVAQLHNASGLTAPVDTRIQPYFGRDIQVIWADRIARAAADRLAGTPLEGAPLIGTLSEVGGWAEFADHPEAYPQITRLYGG